MARHFYARPDDDLARSAIAITASDEDTAYPATNLVREDAAASAKLTTTSGWFLFEFDDPIAPVAAALIYHYLDEGLEVRIQANSSDSWSSPPVDELITIPDKRLDGPSYQKWTRNAIVDLDLGEDSYAFWRLHIVGTNSQAVAIGRLLLLSTWRAVDLFVDGDMEESDDAGEIAQPTALGVETILVLEGPRRAITAMLIATDLNAGTAPVQDAADFRALHQSAEGRAHPFLFMPFDEPWLVRPDSAQRSWSHRAGGYQVWSLPLKEVSRGLPWP